MEASRIPELFVDYCQQLEPAQQQRTARILGEIALGHRPELAEHLPAATRLMVDLSVRRFGPSFATLKADLEQLFADRGQLDAWSRAADATPPQGLDFRNDWHYPLQLWGVLYQMGSPIARDAYDY